MSKKELLNSDNPALAFLSKAQELNEDKPTPAPEQKQDGSKLTAEELSEYFRKQGNTCRTREAKTRRINLLIPPSMAHALMADEYEKNISITEAINRAIEYYLSNKDEL